ncbi:hypothetical protein BDN67DRAFT_898018, partial [Paxillus ammoniavirescens]
GGFGVVHSGDLGSRVVAVKTLWDVTIVWRYVHHPCCLPFHGLCSVPGWNREVTAFVSPWMHRNNLRKYLKCNPKANRTMLILDVVRGLNYLYSMQPHVVHGDLKPVCFLSLSLGFELTYPQDSILITKEGRACLAYVGLNSESTFLGRTRLETVAG